MAKSWIDETLTKVYSNTATKTGYIADGSFFEIQDSSDSDTIFKVFNDSTYYYGMQLWGHVGQPAKFYMCADNGANPNDTWKWMVANGGEMTWDVRTVGTGDPLGDSFNTKMTLSTSGDLTLAGNITATSATAQFNALVAPSLTSSGEFILDVANDIVLDADGGNIYFKDGGTTYMDFQVDGSNDKIAVTGDLTLDVSGDITLDADGGDITFKDASTTIAKFTSGESFISLSNNDAGLYNTLFGKAAGDAIESGGNNNTAIGHNAGTGITTGDDNTLVGFQAGNDITTTSGNSFLGYEAGENATGANNVGIGKYAGKGTGSGLTGNANVCVGYATGYQFDGSAADNVLIGGSAGLSISSGTRNTFLGSNSGDALTTGTHNIAIGYSSLGADTDGTGIVSIGYQAMNACTNPGNFNIAIGYQALDVEGVTGGSNIAIGYHSMGNGAVEGSHQVAVGRDSLYSLTSGSYNIAMGYRALYTNSSGDNNTALGYAALYSNNGHLNTAVGKNALYACASGDENVAIGANAADEITTGSSNVAIGYLAMEAADGSESKNIAIGRGALRNMDSDGSNYNVAIGYNAGNDITTGRYNISIGGLSGCSNAAANNLTSDGNISIGYECGEVLEGTAAGNTLIGHQTADVMTTGQYNVVVGRNAMGAAQDIDNCAVVGTNALASLNHVNGDGSIAIGKNALNAWNPSSGSANQGQMTAIGFHALEDAVDGSTQNTAVGYYALNNLTTASANVAIGNQVLKLVTTNGSNVGIGHAAGQSVVCGSGSDGGTHNTVIGNSAGQYCGEGLGNTFIGSASGLGNSGAHLSGDFNTALGYNAGKTLEGAATNNTLLGHNAGDTLTTGAANTAIGKASLATATTSDYCVAIGTYAGNDINSNDANGSTLIGYNAGAKTTDGRYTTAVGYQSFANNLIGDKNTGLGYESGMSFVADTDGHGQLTALGFRAGKYVSTGTGNTAVGAAAMESDTDNMLTGDNNTVVGCNAGIAMITSAAKNTIMGQGAGSAMTTGVENVFMGNLAANTVTTGRNNVIIGYGSDVDTNTDSNCVAIGHSATAQNNNEVRVGTGGAFQLYSMSKTVDLSDATDDTAAHTAYLFKIPAGAVIKSVTAVVTTLSQNTTANFNIQMSDDTSRSDGNTLTNGVELLGAGEATTISYTSTTASDIAAGSGAVLNASWYSEPKLNGLSSADRYVYICNAGTSNGDSDPGTDPVVRVCIEFAGQD